MITLAVSGEVLVADLSMFMHIFFNMPFPCSSLAMNAIVVVTAGTTYPFFRMGFKAFSPLRRSSQEEIVFPCSNNWYLARTSCWHSSPS